MAALSVASEVLTADRVLADYRPFEDSIEVVREKRMGDAVVVAVRFEDRSGLSRRALVGVRETEYGWERSGGAFVGSARATGDREIWETSGGWAQARLPETKPSWAGGSPFRERCQFGSPIRWGAFRRMRCKVASPS